MPSFTVPPILADLIGRLGAAVPARARPDRRDKPREQRLLICTDSNLPTCDVIIAYAKRWTVELLFKDIKHSWGLKDAWQRSRQGLMRWVTLLGAATP